MQTLTVTIGASATQATTLDLYASVMLVKASGTDYIGGPGVTSSNGVPLSTTPLVIPCPAPRGISLKNAYFAGTQNDTIVIAYEPSA